MAWLSRVPGWVVSLRAAETDLDIPTPRGNPEWHHHGNNWGAMCPALLLWVVLDKMTGLLCTLCGHIVYHLSAILLDKHISPKCLQVKKNLLSIKFFPLLRPRHIIRGEYIGITMDFFPFYVSRRRHNFVWRKTPIFL